MLISLSDPPELLVTNFQYPGRITHVAIFAADKSINDITGSEDTPDIKTFKQMWKRFRDGIPDTEEDRLQLFEKESSSPSWGDWLPSDTTWARKEDKGVFPRSDFKNQR